MKWLVLGATGLLGPHFVDELRARGNEVITSARSGADYCFDLSKDIELLKALGDIDPDGVINCAANIYVDKCEADPVGAYMLNARPLGFLANWSREHKRPIVHISTDCFYVEGEDRAHPETDPVVLVNDYARTKWLGERLAETSPFALILRTNLIGAAKGHGRWTVESLKTRGAMTLFMDFYCSPIHVSDLARAGLDLYEKGATGTYNVSARDVASKGALIYAVAEELGVNPDWVVEGSGKQLSVQRPMSLGLDVSRAEAILGYTLPTLKDTAHKLAIEKV